jgi:hypothetical protein
VTGAAGLLLAFDPAMSIDSVKSYLINGAKDGGRTASGYPILNAYDALKRAARKRGAPLCGNVLYPDSAHDIVIARNDSATVTDTIQSGDPPYQLLAALHGGRTIYLSDSAAASTMTWTSDNSWTGPISNSAAFDTLSGYELSSVNLADGLNHDGDTTIFYNQGGYYDPGCACAVDTNFVQYLYPTGTTDYTVLGTLSLSAISGGYLMNEGAGIAYSGAGGTVYIALPLTDGTSFYCALYSVAIANPPNTIEPLGSTTQLSNCVAANLASSEDGTRLMLNALTTDYSNYIAVINSQTGSVIHQFNSVASVPMFSPNRVPRRPQIAAKGTRLRTAASQPRAIA